MKILQESFDFILRRIVMIPIYAWTLIVIFFSIGTVISYKGKEKTRGVTIFFISFVIVIVSLTLLSREPCGIHRFVINPFHNYWCIYMNYSRKEHLFEIIGNVILFIPIGCLYKYTIFFAKIGWVFFVIVFSCSIEIIQFTTTVGIFEISDIVHNCLGFGVGWIVATCFYNIKNWRKIDGNSKKQ